MHLPFLREALAGVTSRWTKKAALDIADFECSTPRETLKFSAAFLGYQEPLFISKS
jgi:hypothetical protein